jgi:hypothetical protein
MMAENTTANKVDEFAIKFFISQRFFANKSTTYLLLHNSLGI